jgi:hypothetical protein
MVVKHQPEYMLMSSCSTCIVDECLRVGAPSGVSVQFLHLST